MAFDGIITCAMVKEMQDKIKLGKIEKIYQPERDELVFHIHTKLGNCKLFASCNSSNPRIHFIEDSPANPSAPLSFCMLLRKHLQGGRIVNVEQKNSERIIEIYVETFNELGFTVTKKLIFEIMGKHSNIILIDMTTGKILDSIKRISIDVNRKRQILPGKIYEFPPEQDKIPFKEITLDQMCQLSPDSKTYLATIGGISPGYSQQLSDLPSCRAAYDFLQETIMSINEGSFVSRIYFDDSNEPKDFHIVPLSQFEGLYTTQTFDSLSKCISYYFQHKQSSNRVNQKSHDLIKNVSAHLEKLYLKKQRLNEDLLQAENSDELRLFGELLTANLHMIKPGMKKVEVKNYYDDSTVLIPLDSRYSPAKNSQIYFKKYGKMKTSIKEKQIQLMENDSDINYLESVLTYLNNTDSVVQVEALQQELIETGYMGRKRKASKEPKQKTEPCKFVSDDGLTILVGRNNKENDIITLKTARKTDYWFHTKDIPGSHVIVQTNGMEIPDTTIIQAAEVAAFHSKGRNSENVPVDYVQVKYIKKPAGAKPGMVIFTNNKTIWVNPSCKLKSTSKKSN